MYRILFLLLATLLTQNCQRSAPASVPEATVQAPANTALPADFAEFYQRFHSDSLYQIAHIGWPLQGDMSEQIDSTHYRPKPRTWNQADWHMMRLNFNPNDYKMETEMLGEGLVIERIRAKAVNYGLERRFAKQPNGEWEMIYYSDVQERGK